MKQIRRLWHDYSLLWVLLVVFIVAVGVESRLEYTHMAQEYRWHGDVLTVGTYWTGFVRILAGRVAASVLVLIVFTVTRAWFIFKGSPVSKDGPDERTALIRAILAALHPHG